ncbi:MAG: hypothetical protein MUF68_09500 [Cyclobacteriaceae bacterium]|jgi:hypothetical protein|nr:hypothetical protein [Cyclobacteriaceae bacterium]
MILNKDKQLGEKDNRDDGRQKPEKQPAQEDIPKQKECADDEENPYGGLPERNLKKNLGCG